MAVIRIYAILFAFCVTLCIALKAVDTANNTNANDSINSVKVQQLNACKNITCYKNNDTCIVNGENKMVCIMQLCSAAVFYWDDGSRFGLANNTATECNCSIGINGSSCEQVLQCQWTTNYTASTDILNYSQAICECSNGYSAGVNCQLIDSCCLNNQTEFISKNASSNTAASNRSQPTNTSYCCYCLNNTATLWINCTEMYRNGKGSLSDISKIPMQMATSSSPPVIGEFVTVTNVDDISATTASVLPFNETSSLPPTVITAAMQMNIQKQNYSSTTKTLTGKNLLNSTEQTVSFANSRQFTTTHTTLLDSSSPSKNLPLNVLMLTTTSVIISDLTVANAGETITETAVTVDEHDRLLGLKASKLTFPVVESDTSTVKTATEALTTVDNDNALTTTVATITGSLLSTEAVSTSNYNKTNHSLTNWTQNIMSQEVTTTIVAVTVINQPSSDSYTLTLSTAEDINSFNTSQTDDGSGLLHSDTEYNTTGQSQFEDSKAPVEIIISNTDTNVQETTEHPLSVGTEPPKIGNENSANIVESATFSAFQNNNSTGNLWLKQLGMKSGYHSIQWSTDDKPQNSVVVSAFKAATANTDIATLVSLVLLSAVGCLLLKRAKQSRKLHGRYSPASEEIAHSTKYFIPLTTVPKEERLI